jgi:hypothetical protein
MYGLWLLVMRLTGKVDSFCMTESPHLFPRVVINGLLIDSLKQVSIGIIPMMNGKGKAD